MIKRLLFPCALLSLLISGCGDNTDTPATPDAPPVSQVKPISYSIVKSYPHDTSFFTQGLVMYKGQLYESTGGSGSSPVSSRQVSELMKVNLATGKIEKTIPIDKKYFGEGITILNDTIYQLTWREKKVFAYDMQFKKLKEFDINTEGWGITTDGKVLIVSTGDSNLYFYEPGTFKLLRTQSVTKDGELLNNLNELEYIDDYIYANQWGAPYIYKIDPASGNIVGVIDFSQLKDKVTGNLPDNTDRVLNGIAYDAATKKIYITGKLWPELFEIQLGQ